MYRTLFIIAALFCNCITGFSQVAIDSFYKQNATWTNFWTWRISPNSHTFLAGVNGFQYTINGDTSISGVQYHKLYHKGIGSYICDYNDWSNVIKYDTTTTPYEYMGELRVDGKKVFFVFEGSKKTSCYIKGQEILLYDFGLNVGDTFFHCTYKPVVSKIDSVQLPGGQYLKRFYFGLSADYTIEGIGSTLGLVAPDIASPSGTEPYWGGSVSLCYDAPPLAYHFDLVKIQQQLSDNCFDIKPLSVHNISKQDKLELYPNPSNGNFSLSGESNSKNLTMHVNDVKGQTVYAANMVNNGNYINRAFNLQNLGPGIYFVKLTTDTGQKYFKLVIE